MLRKTAKLFAGSVVLVSLCVTAQAANNDKAIKKLTDEVPGTVVSVNEATGTATFVRIPPGQAKKLSGSSLEAKNQAATEYVSKNAEAFGLRVGSNDLKHLQTEKDAIGHTHVRYTQEYGGVPVFGSSLSVHFDDSDGLIAATGVLIPDIEVSVAPSRSAAEAGELALNWVAANTMSGNLAIQKSRLVIYREGLAQGVPGDNHLAYQVEVGNGADVREFVFVDAHTGKYIDQITGITDGLHRRAYDGNGGDFAYVLTVWPEFPYWVEGDAFPTASGEANNMILASKETYDVFANAFGRDSFDGAGAPMDAIFNRGYSCPNASWNGAFISFCPGITTDDVTGHEWGHAYTQYTDDLIYAWQPGALNESYSDVIGETVDLINGRDDLTAPGGRTDGSCTIYDGTPLPVFTVDTGGAAGTYFVTASVNEPPAPFTIGSLPMVHAKPADGCEPLTNAADVAGNIVVIDWEDNGAPSRCGSATRAFWAKNAGAEGIVFVAPESGLLNLGSRPNIGSVQVSYADGEFIKANLPANGTISFSLGTDDSYRWLMGEDSTASGLVGALRDMWNPNCMGDPAKVTDQLYWCSTGDNGGVHINSGIPNKAFSLMVDGGTFNGYTVGAIGLTKANHIQFRAKTHYQGPATDFVGHADALEQSCADLVGTNLASLTDGTPSGEIISAADCAEVSKAIAAVELRTPPTQCGFKPLLAKNPPPLCDSPTKSARMLLSDNFDNGKSSLARWSRSNFGTAPEYIERGWELTSILPEDRKGNAFFAIDPNTSCVAGNDQSSAMSLESPQIALPASLGPDNMRMAFDHYVSTEDGYDGGNVKISVNNGEWITIEPADFVYNAYNINGWGVDFIPGAPFTSNPLGWEAGHFSGGDQGSVAGSWGTSIINLAPYANPTDKIRIRFDFGTDFCAGTNLGWYIDDVKVYECR